MSESNDIRIDAERYRALREMNWHDGPLAVVRDPKVNVRLGTDCPSHERLDALVDQLVKSRAPEVEIRADHTLARKDRWEVTVRRIVALLWGNHWEFECDEVVEAVRQMCFHPDNDAEQLVSDVLAPPLKVVA